MGRSGGTDQDEIRLVESDDLIIKKPLFYVNYNFI